MDGKGRPAKVLLEHQIRQAMKHTKSNRAAARFLNVTLPTYRQYAKAYTDFATGKSLYELHKNKQGAGVLKFQNKSTKEPRLEELLKNGMSLESYSVEKLKQRLQYENLLKNECYKCGFHEERVLDRKIP